MLSTVVLGFMFTVIHISDGGVDDFVSTALIASTRENNQHDHQPSFDFPAVIVTNGDCELLAAFSAYQKTVRLLAISPRLGVSPSRLWMPFPWEWRKMSKEVNSLPLFKDIKPIEADCLYEGNLLLAEMLRTSKKVKIIVTGPLTTISDVLKIHPELKTVITEMHWAAGAINVPGNISESPEIPKELLNEKAEWNVFADPEAADWIFKNTEFPILLYPLDLSNQTTPQAFLKVLLQEKSTIYSTFAEQCYQIVQPIEDYRMWNVTATAGVLFPDLFDPPIKDKLRVTVCGKEMGSIVRDPKGREVSIFMKFKGNDPDALYRAAAIALTRQAQN